MRRLAVFLLALLAGPAAVGFVISIHHGSGGGGPVPVNIAMPQAIGEDFPTSPATTITLTADNGLWDNLPTSYSYSWHDLGGTVLGTGPTLALSTTGGGSAIGKVVELDVTATNAGGSATATSHWFGPIEASAPVAPVAYETQSPVPTSIPLPVSPANFLENGHAVFPGCDIPPASPNLDPVHVWYFDPIRGQTQTAMTAAGVPTASQGHFGHAFKDLNAFFDDTSVAGYSGALFGFGKTIPPGDTVYIEPGDATHSGGSLVTGISQYSTSDGTATGTPVFTWVMADPASARPTVVTDASNGAILFNHGAKAFIFKNLNVEPSQDGANMPAISVGGSAAFPVSDILYEGIHVSGWRKHSDDRWDQSVYPTSGGHSDGTVVTATPAIPNTGLQDGNTIVATATSGATALAITTLPPGLGRYIMANGYYRDTNDSIFGAATGIPLGTISTALNGLDSSHYRNADITGAPLNLQVNAFAAANLTGLTFRAVETTVAAITSQAADTLGYYVLQANSTAVQSVYTWNGSAWVSIGTFLPSSWAVTNAVFLLTNNTHVAHWDGTSWTDLGTPVLTIAPCDPVADAGTGCPTSAYTRPSDGAVLSGTGHDNVPGCEPITVFRGTTFGGCGSGTIPAWSGTTRALSSTRIQSVEQIRILPAGYFNNADWGTSFSAGFVANGATTSGFGATPNVFVGVTCISLKDSWFRDLRNAAPFGAATNSIAYDNRTKYTSADSFDVYSDHRVWLIHNWASDPTEIWDHQDAIQHADASGTGRQLLYNNADIENELIQNVAVDNPFPRSWQGINVTDNILWGTYVAVNVVTANTNGIGIGGKYNVVVHNDMFGSGIVDGQNRKVPDGLPPHAFIANNVANGISRDTIAALASTQCDPVSGDLATVETNLSIPFIPVGSAANSSVYCLPGTTGAVSANPSPGVYVGLSAWTQTDWRTDQSGVSPLFTEWDPLTAAGTPGAGLWTATTYFPCPQLSILPFACSMGGMGAINERPNAGFAGTTATILGNVSSMFPLPQTGTIGDAYVLTGLAGCFGGQASWCGPAGSTWQPGLLVRIGNSLTDATLNWQHTVDPLNSLNFILPPFIPGIIHAGTNLGAQQPIATHDGKAWGSPPSIGAY